MIGRMLAVAVVACALLSCAPSDPRAKVLSERARWEVQALEWVQTPDGSIQISTRVSGPPNATIDKLTVRIDLVGDGESLLRADWHTFDLTSIQRGGPADRSIRLEPLEGAEVEGISIDMMLNPTDEESGRIVELSVAG